MSSKRGRKRKGSPTERESTSELVERLVDCAKDQSAYEFHSSDYDSDAPTARRTPAGKKTPAKRASKGPLEDLSSLRPEPEGTRRYDNYERSVIFMAMAAARARVGAQPDELGGAVFRETCKLLDEYHPKFPISCRINPRVLHTIWSFFKKNGHTYAKNIESAGYRFLAIRSAPGANYLDSHRKLYSRR